MSFSKEILTALKRAEIRMPATAHALIVISPDYVNILAQELFMFRNEIESDVNIDAFENFIREGRAVVHGYAVRVSESTDKISIAWMNIKKTG